MFSVHNFSKRQSRELSDLFTLTFKSIAGQELQETKWAPRDVILVVSTWTLGLLSAALVN